jgi:hypothetical protein
MSNLLRYWPPSRLVLLAIADARPPGAVVDALVRFLYPDPSPVVVFRCRRQQFVSYLRLGVLTALRAVFCVVVEFADRFVVELVFLRSTKQSTFP